jgi:transposase
MNNIRKTAKVTVGVDVGDKYCIYQMIDSTGEILDRGKFSTTKESVIGKFKSMKPCRVVIETGTHSPWMSREIAKCGHEVIVANSRKVALINQNTGKTDTEDADLLSELGQFKPKLLYPVKHRSEKVQKDLAAIRSRDKLVEARSKLIIHVRGIVKSVGGRITGVTAEAFGGRVLKQVPDGLKAFLEPMLNSVEFINQQIREFDKMVERMCEDEYPETKRLRQIKGVGPLTALAFVLIIEDPWRFKNNRSIGKYLGLVPRLDDSGEQHPQLGITKAGDLLMRRLLVNCASYMMGPFGEDSDLRRWAEKLSQRGGKNAKKRARVALARKLSVVMLSLWKTGEAYAPLSAHEDGIAA